MAQDVKIELGYPLYVICTFGSNEKLSFFRHFFTKYMRTLTHISYMYLYTRFLMLSVTNKKCSKIDHKIVTIVTAMAFYLFERVNTKFFYDRTKRTYCLTN